MSYCNDKILDDKIKVYKVKNERFKFPIRRIIPSSFDINFLDGEIKEETDTLTVEINSDNFFKSKSELVSNNNFDLDTKWLYDSINYISSLSIEDKFTLYGYTQNGDVFSNLYLRDEKNNLEDYINTKIYVRSEYYEDGEIYFPLFFQAMRVIKNNNKYTKLRGLFSGKNSESYMKLLENKDEVSIEFWIEVIKEFIRDLTRIIDKCPKTTKEFVVYRGIKDKYISVDKKIFVNSTFMSTSLDYTKALEFVENGCCLKRIIIPKKSTIIFIECITQNKDEVEALILPGNKFKVESDNVQVYKDIEYINYGATYDDILCNNKLVDNKLEIIDMKLKN